MPVNSTTCSNSVAILAVYCRRIEKAVKTESEMFECSIYFRMYRCIERFWTFICATTSGFTFVVNFISLFQFTVVIECANFTKHQYIHAL